MRHCHEHSFYHENCRNCVYVNNYTPSENRISSMDDVQTSTFSIPTYDDTSSDTSSSDTSSSSDSFSGFDGGSSGGGGSDF